MPAHDGDLPRKEVQKRMESDEPLIGTPLLDLSLRLDLPFRGVKREELVAVVRQNVRERRKADVLTKRAQENAVAPIRGAFQAETQEMLRERISEITRRGGQD